MTLWKALYHFSRKGMGGRYVVFSLNINQCLTTEQSPVPFAADGFTNVPPLPLCKY